MKLKVMPGAGLKGDITAGLPGDKSLSHRAALFAALAEGESIVDNFLDSGVTRAMLSALKKLGVKWTLEQNRLALSGGGLYSFRGMGQTLDCGNSATTLRLLAGALAASGLGATLDGSAGLRARPMARIVDPLKTMGVPIQASDLGTAPLVLSARDKQTLLSASEFWLEQASAQVKTCLMLAALAGDGITTIHEPAVSRDHSERMLASMGVLVEKPDSLTVMVTPPQDALSPLQIRLPADVSAAAFMIVAGLILPGSDLWLRNVGVNPGRIGLIEALQSMGSHISLHNHSLQAGEPTADIHICYSDLHAISIEGDLVVRMIDEFPIFAVAAACAQGKTSVHDAIELRYKESDRIQAIVKQFSTVGVDVHESLDGFTIIGGRGITGGRVDSGGDHRLAMSLAVLGMVSEAGIQVTGAEMIEESFPNFVTMLTSLGAAMEWVQ